MLVSHLSHVPLLSLSSLSHTHKHKHAHKHRHTARFLSPFSLSLFAITLPSSDMRSGRRHSLIVHTCAAIARGLLQEKLACNRLDCKRLPPLIQGLTCTLEPWAGRQEGGNGQTSSRSSTYSEARVAAAASDRRGDTRALQYSMYRLRNCSSCAASSSSSARCMPACLCTSSTCLRPSQTLNASARPYKIMHLNSSYRRNELPAGLWFLP